MPRTRVQPGRQRPGSREVAAHRFVAPRLDLDERLRGSRGVSGDQSPSWWPSPAGASRTLLGEADGLLVTGAVHEWADLKRPAQPEASRDRTRVPRPSASGSPVPPVGPGLLDGLVLGKPPDVPPRVGERQRGARGAGSGTQDAAGIPAKPGETAHNGLEHRRPRAELSRGTGPGGRDEHVGIRCRIDADEGDGGPRSLRTALRGNWRRSTPPSPTGTPSAVGPRRHSSPHRKN